MIIFDVSGGLGNQFFQYAFGRYLALKNDTLLRINVKSYELDDQRDFKLAYFDTKYEILDVAEIEEYIRSYSKLHPLLRKFYRKYWPISNRIYFENLEFVHDFNYKNARKGFFYGYWSHSNYFEEIRATLLLELKLKKQFKTAELERYLSEVNESVSVSVHVRRGDYVHHPIYSSLFTSLDHEYYVQAVSMLNKELTNPTFYIFSDDYQWVKANLKLPKAKMVFVSDLALDQDYLEFELMRSCKHFIIANSTFSWWAAWLSNYSEKRVIAPKKWYKKDIKNTIDFLPKSWSKI